MRTVFFLSVLMLSGCSEKTYYERCMDNAKKELSCIDSGPCFGEDKQRAVDIIAICYAGSQEENAEKVIPKAFTKAEDEELRTKCSDNLVELEKLKFILRRPENNRFFVDEEQWMSLAESQGGFLYTAFCSLNGPYERKAQGGKAIYVYGHQSGNLLATKDRTGEIIYNR